MPLPTAISWVVSTAWAQKNHGTSANSTALPILLTPKDKLLPRHRNIRMSCSLLNLIWILLKKCGPHGSSSETEGPRRMRNWWNCKKIMPEFKKPKSEKEFERNFAQIKPLMNETQAYYESARCLFCFDAPCVNACPTSIDIPLFIRQINSGNEMGAAKTIYDSNWLGHACGQVCPTEVLCEGACVYNNQGVKPIEIGRLQAFATNKAIADDKKLFITGKPNGKK